LSELEQDVAYEDVVSPLLFEVFRPTVGETYVDLGCGEGRLMRQVSRLGARVIGVDINIDLASRTEKVMIAELPGIPVRDAAVDGAYSVLTLEHIADHYSFFLEARRVVRPRGVLAIVINHPVWTAPGSTPVTDSEGEVLWRSGDYFGSGNSDEPADSGFVRFHHRSMAELMNSASSAGWKLEVMVERPHHELFDQKGIPRLLACRWAR
jgi:SAM-dependent methyltransferase